MLELAWAAVFVMGAAAMRVGMPGTLVLAAIAGTTVVVTVIALAQPSYHGVLWRWINPKLPQWWCAHAGARSHSARVAGDGV